MSKTTKQPTTKQPRVIKVKTVIISLAVAGSAVACGLGVNYLRDQAYNTGYNQGYDKGVKAQSNTDKVVIERVKEIKALISELK